MTKTNHLTRNPHNFVVQIFTDDGSVIEYFDSVTEVLTWLDYNIRDVFRRVTITYIGEE